VSVGGPMQHEAIDVIRPQMFERARHGLSDLRGKIGFRVVRKTMILARLIREFGLEEKVGTRHQTRAIHGSQPLADSGFKVVPPLVRGVDAPEAGADRELSERGRTVFLPRRAVEEIRNWSQDYFFGRANTM